MKKILIALLVLSISYSGSAQSEKFTGAMTSNLSLLDSAKTADDLLAVSGNFERIGDAEKSQWLPYYYASLSEVFYAFAKNDMANNDQYADKAEQLLNKAEALAKDNSEISVVKSMIATLRMLVNPMQRWSTYGSAIEEGLNTAKKLDPTNPRPFLMQGQNLRNTPEQFGGGCATAKPILEEAVKKFEAFKPASALSPSWGRKQATQVLESCK